MAVMRLHLHLGSRNIPGLGYQLLQLSTVCLRQLPSLHSIATDGTENAASKSSPIVAFVSVAAIT
jgi:hypothetical protein